MSKSTKKTKKGKVDKKELLRQAYKEEINKPKEFKETIGFGKFEFANKIIYIGAYKQLKTGEKMRDGYGKLMHNVNDNSDIGQEYYEGYWKDDMMSGYGIYHYSNGDIYEGNWANSLQNGFGVYTFNDGHYYEGEWKNHQMEGTGKYFDLNGVGFTGEFREGNYFSKEQAKLKEEKKMLKKIAKRKEVPFTVFFRSWDEAIQSADKKNVNEILSPFFAKKDNMGMYFKNVTFPEYEDYKPEYWNDVIRWVLCQPAKALDLTTKTTSKKKSSSTKGITSKSSTKTIKVEDTKKVEIVPNIVHINPDEPQAESKTAQKIEIIVPKNGSDLKLLPKDSLVVKQLQDETPTPSGEVIEIITSTEERTVSLGISSHSESGRWLIVYFSDTQAPAKEVKKTKKAASKSKSKSKKK
ncbi:MAG: hypothetical protein MJ252_21360 [archaeon]|nr:hypothetical protein [archaeon]